MSIIRQQSLFDMQVLFELEPTQRFNSILSSIDIHPILDVVMKKSRFGQKKSLNYSAMIYSLIIRITDRIPFIKDLVKRLDKDLRFKVDCGFLVSDEIPSEGFVSDETIAIDATHVESRDRAPFKTEKVEKEPEKRGRKKKVEREQWLLEKAEMLHCSGEKAKVHFDLVHIAYNACKIAVDRLTQLQISVA